MTGSWHPPTEALSLARFRDEETHQTTTFDRQTSKKIPVRRGETATIAEATGQGHIALLWLTFPGWFWQNWEPQSPVSATILKTMILRIYWDGSDSPAVEAPVGDFFGVGLCEVANFTSKYFGMSSGGFYCRFPMPFRKGFRIEVENLDRVVDTKVYANVLYQLTGETTAEEVGYFHACFRTGENTGSDPLLISELTGRGHYVGCALSMQAAERNYLGYLEAPEYVYVDDDWEDPRFVGSGLEDYFLGGWYFREGCFGGDLHGLPVKDALNSSVAMDRVHEADAISFRRRFRLEFVDPFRPALHPFRFSAVSFAYLDRHTGTPPPLADIDTLVGWYRLRDRDHQSIP